MLIDWCDDYLIDIDVVDKQHKEIFDRARKLNEVCLADGGEKNVQEILDFLKNYAIEHFQSEEKFMRESGYASLEEHLKLLLHVLGTFHRR